MGTGRPSWLVVLGPRHHWWVVLVPRCQLRVVLLGPRRFSWVEWLGPGHIVCGWWWYALVVPFVNGGGGVPLSVFVWHGHRHCRGGPVITRGVSSSLSCVPRRCHVSSPCHCPLPSSSLSCNVVVAVPSL